MNRLILAAAVAMLALAGCAVQGGEPRGKGKSKETARIGPPLVGAHVVTEKEWEIPTPPGALAAVKSRREIGEEQREYTADDLQAVVDMTDDLYDSYDPVPGGLADMHAGTIRYCAALDSAAAILENDVLGGIRRLQLKRLFEGFCEPRPRAVEPAVSNCEHLQIDNADLVDRLNHAKAGEKTAIQAVNDVKKKYAGLKCVKRGKGGVERGSDGEMWERMYCNDAAVKHFEENTQ